MQCRECLKEKDEDSFAWRRLNVKRATICRSCQSNASKNHYKNNKTDYVKRVTETRNATRRQNQQKIVEYLKEHPCVECGQSDIVLLEFDHLYDKSDDVSVIASTRTWAVVEAEIKKCQILCVVCHRYKTARANNWYRLNSGPVV